MFEARQQGSLTILEGVKELDVRTATQAKDALKKLIAQGQNRMLIDLSSLGFIDSAGLGALVTGLKAARTAGGDVWLYGLTSAVRSIFELTRLYQVFRIFPSLDLALDDAQKRD